MSALLALGGYGAAYGPHEPDPDDHWIGRLIALVVGVVLGFWFTVATTV